MTRCMRPVVLEGPQRLKKGENSHSNERKDQSHNNSVVQHGITLQYQTLLHSLGTTFQSPDTRRAAPGHACISWRCPVYLSKDGMGVCHGAMPRSHSCFASRALMGPSTAATLVGDRCFSQNCGHTRIRPSQHNRADTQLARVSHCGCSSALTSPSLEQQAHRRLPRSLERTAGGRCRGHPWARMTRPVHWRLVPDWPSSTGNSTRQCF